MTELLVGGKTFELVMEENAEQKRKEMGVEKVGIQALFERNPDAVLESSDNEPVMITGDITVVFYKEKNRVLVRNVYGANQVL